MIYFKSTRGIGLLERILSLSIIALLLLTAIRYFNTANRDSKLDETVQTLSIIMDAVDRWHETDKENTKKSISKQKLIELGLLPKHFAEKSANPWGGAITITSHAAGAAKITLTNMPNHDCLALQDMMAKRNMSVSCQGTTFKAIYPVGEAQPVKAK